MKAFWEDKLAIRDEPYVARIDNNHYIIGKGTSKFKGMGGDENTIRFDDGRIVTTNDLWHQGEIPDEYRNRLPNNAHWVRKIEVSYE